MGIKSCKAMRVMKSGLGKTRIRTNRWRFVKVDAARRAENRKVMRKDVSRRTSRFGAIAAPIPCYDVWKLQHCHSKRGISRIVAAEVGDGSVDTVATSSSVVVDVLFALAALMLVLATIVVLYLNIGYVVDKQNLQKEDDDAFEQLGFGSKSELEASKKRFTPLFGMNNSKEKNIKVTNDEEDNGIRTNKSQIAASSKGFGKKK